MPSLRVEGLRKAFDGKPVLRDVSFEARPGDIVSVIGPSGCGKTTVFRCILGEITPDAGRIFVDNEDVTNIPTEKRGVGIVYQNYALFPHLSVEENVAYGLRAAGKSKNQSRDRVREMLEVARLPDSADKRPNELSGGERQRVALARALAVEPKILLLDEAFAALDAATRGNVVQEVRAMIKRLNVTTLLITHDQEEAFLFSKRVVVLNDGMVVVQGRPSDVMATEDAFVKSFVQMLMIERTRVVLDDGGLPCVRLESGRPVPIDIPGLNEGDEVHVMIKKGPRTESIEVWPRDPE